MRLFILLSSSSISLFSSSENSNLFLSSSINFASLSIITSRGDLSPKLSGGICLMYFSLSGYYLVNDLNIFSFSSSTKLLNLSSIYSICRAKSSVFRLCDPESTLFNTPSIYLTLLISSSHLLSDSRNLAEFLFKSWIDNSRYLMCDSASFNINLC